MMSPRAPGHDEACLDRPERLKHPYVVRSRSIHTAAHHARLLGAFKISETVRRARNEASQESPPELRFEAIAYVRRTCHFISPNTSLLHPCYIVIASLVLPQRTKLLRYLYKVNYLLKSRSCFAYRRNSRVLNFTVFQS